MPCRGRRLLPVMVVLASIALTAQMPDWKFFRDREGNTYFIDQGGKIRITDTPERPYRAVSPRGIDYYLNFGITLINDHRVHEGLTVLKSIRALPADNGRIVQAQVKATEVLNSLKRRNGPRFDEQNEAASLMFIETEGGVRAINDRMYYSFTGPAGLSVIRKNNRGRLEYRYEGVLFGARGTAASNGESKAYDFLIAVDSEKFAVRFKDLDQAIEYWQGRAGYGGLERRVREKRDDRIVYSYTNRSAPRYAGLEAVFVNGKITHCVRLITSEDGYLKYGTKMDAVMSSFRIVSGQD
ncbi:MAG TPA: hypothetical protein PK307_11455 [Spirochaetota bacterium]|nr:hypothetical protein [Spirochaetota bacterium]HQL82814.1 hypothetical protein [Spirochaetota bacterium]